MDLIVQVFSFIVLFFLFQLILSRAPVQIDLLFKMYGKRQEERYRNRIRKRNAELLLLTGQHMGHHNKMNGDEVKSAGNKQQQHSSSADNSELQPPAAKLARELSMKLYEEKEKRIATEFVLTLNRLNGRHLSVRDIASLVHSVLLNSVEKPKWFYFKGARSLQTVLLRINCLPIHFVTQPGDHVFMDSFFERSWLRLANDVNDRPTFWKGLSTTKETKYAYLKKRIHDNGDPIERLRGDDIKLELLVTLEQMIDNNYPLVDREEDGAGGVVRIMPTKDKYQNVTRDSPVFVLDCEMCLTSEKRSELTRVSIVNINGEVVLDTLVKPLNKITNYLTKHSGITEKMLESCNVRLTEVQHAIRTILPRDAILCGHSIEFDLRALQMSHPFCIDLSLLFNLSRNPKSKSSLRTLAHIFLGEDIQNSVDGHCSVEDSIATLKLLRLKLEKGIIFGNVILDWDFRKWAVQNGLTEFGTRISDIISAISNATEQKSASKEVRRSTVVSTRRLCARCSKSLTIDCPVKNCLCTRTATTTISSSVDSKVTSPQSASSLTNITPVKSNRDRQRRALTLCVSCISSSGIRRRLLRKPRSGGERILTISSSLSSTNEPRSGASSPHSKTLSPSSSSNKSRGGTPPCEDFVFDSETSDEEDGKNLFNFHEALHVEKGLSQTKQLSESVGSTKKRILFAVENPNEFMNSNERSIIIPCGPAHLNFLESKITPCLMEYDVSMLEANCAHPSITNQQIDGIVKSVVDGTCNNGLVMVVMASAKKSIMYMKIKK